MKRIPLLKNNLSPAEITQIREFLREKHFKKGEAIINQNEVCARIFLVLSGRVKLTLTSLSGDEQVLEILETGGTCSCHTSLGEAKCGWTAVAMEPTSVWFVRKDVFVKLARTNPNLMAALNALFSDRIQCFTRLVGELTLYSGRERLARYFLSLPTASPQHPDIVNLHLTREELAQLLNMTRETVMRQLAYLVKAKCITATTRRSFILNREALAKVR